MKQSKQKRVLYVEDDKQMQEYMISIFENFIKDCTLVVATNGQDALNEFKKENFDLILSDVIMPKMDGVEFYNKVQKSQQKEIPFCFITAYPENINRDIKTSVNVINKPFRLDNMITFVENKLNAIK